MEKQEISTGDVPALGSHPINAFAWVNIVMPTTENSCCIVQTNKHNSALYNINLEIITLLLKTDTWGSSDGQKKGAITRKEVKQSHKLLFDDTAGIYSL